MFFFKILFWIFLLPSFNVELVLLKGFLVLYLVMFLLSFFKLLPVICCPLRKCSLRLVRIDPFQYFDGGGFVEEESPLRLNGLVRILEVHFRSSLCLWAHGRVRISWLFGCFLSVILVYFL